MYFVWPLEYIINNPLYSRNEWRSVIKVKSCGALLHMLLVCSHSYLKSVLRYKFLSFGYLSSGHYIYVSKDVRIRGNFSKLKGLHGQKVRETLIQRLIKVPTTAMMTWCQYNIFSRFLHRLRACLLCHMFLCLCDWFLVWYLKQFSSPRNWPVCKLTCMQ